MKVKTMSALAGLGGALIMSSSADAAFLGIELVNVSAWMSTTANANIAGSYNAAGGPAAFQVYRIFAKFDALGGDNRVNAISGLAGNPWAHTMISGSIHNSFSGAGTTSSPFVANNLAPSSATAGPNGNPGGFGWETWATISRQFGANTASYSPGAHDPGQLNNFEGSWNANDAALFITPDDAQGAAIALNSTSAAGQGGSGIGVLLMQITVTTGSLFSGQFNVNIGAPGLAPQDILGLTYTNVPAPGALALLGLAGLVGGRRRRS
jgi:MYXO-CTERM domain-containing protein